MRAPHAVVPCATAIHTATLLVFFALPFLLCHEAVHAEEPNDTFAQSTVLPAGTLSVTDDLFPGIGSAPNTRLGVFSPDGFDGLFDLLFAADDGSTLGDENAAGLTDIDVNDDNSIRFVVTGNGDLFFEGEHEENGGFKAFVEVFDANDVSIDEFSVTGSLQAGSADQQYSFDDSSWVDGNFTINLDNTVDGFTGGDVDFFTFTGLNPGAAFSAETSSVGSIDTVLGWYNDAGALIAQDDDSGSGFWSLLAGTVPTNGQLTFAVTGSGDDMFLGEHAQQEFYDLQLSVEGAGLEGDFDGDGDVDGFDLTHPTLGWETRFGNGLSGGDFLVWQRELGSVAGNVLAATLPEPDCWLLILTGLAAFSCIRQTAGA